MSLRRILWEKMIGKVAGVSWDLIEVDVRRDVD